MGSCISSRLGSSSISSSSRTITSSNSLSSNKYGNIVRVVHLNGLLEEFEDAVTVEQVTGNQPKHFVFAQTRFLSLDSKPLDSAVQLELGNIYFLLPHYIFQVEMSPIDLATISKRLTSAAQKPVKPPNSTSSSSNFNNNNHNVIMAADTSTAAGLQQQSKLKPNRYTDRHVPPKNLFQNLLQKDHSPRSWKPILESITERSFTSRSTESDSPHTKTLIL